MYGPEGIDFLSDLQIYINSLTTEAPRLDECDIGDMILNLVDVPLVGKKEGRDEESMARDPTRMRGIRNDDPVWELVRRVSDMVLSEDDAERFAWKRM